MKNNSETESSLASRVYTMHKDHKPREDSGMLVGIDGFKGVTKEKIEIGLPIARMSKVRGEFHASIAVVVSIVRNDQLPGGGMVGLKTVWFSSGYKEVYRRKVNSNATFESVCNSPGNYRIYPFNIEQPLPEPEPEKVEELVERSYKVVMPNYKTVEYNPAIVLDDEQRKVFLELAKDNNRLLTEILQTLKELKEKW